MLSQSVPALPMSCTHRGFSLVETVVAVSLMAVVLIGIAQLITLAVEHGGSARTQTMALVLAGQKLEQLRALTWILDGSGTPVSDYSTDTTIAPEAAAGGTGLSPGGALDRDAVGYVDYVDRDGLQIAGDLSGKTSYVRRWSIGLLAGDPNTLVIQVIVAPVPSDRGRVRLMTAKTRKTL